MNILNYFNKKKISVDDFSLMIDNDEFLDQICEETTPNYKMTNGQYLFRLLDKNNKNHEEYQLQMIKKYCSESFILKQKIKNVNQGFNQIQFKTIDFFYTKDYNNELIYIFNANNISDHVFEILIENGLKMVDETTKENISYYRTFKDNPNIEVKNTLLDYVFLPNFNEKKTENLFLFNLFYKNGIKLELDFFFSEYLDKLSEINSLSVISLIDKEMYCSLTDITNIEQILNNLMKKPIIYEKYISVYLNRLSFLEKNIIFDQLYHILNIFSKGKPIDKTKTINLFINLLSIKSVVQTIIKNDEVVLKSILDNNLYELIENEFINELFKKYELKMTSYLVDNKKTELIKIFINMIDVSQDIIDKLLFISITKNELEISSILIECGANPCVEYPEYYGLTSVHVSSYLKQPKEIFNSLLREEIELSLDNYKKWFNKV